MPSLSTFTRAETFSSVFNLAGFIKACFSKSCLQGYKLSIQVFFIQVIIDIDLTILCGEALLPSDKMTSQISRWPSYTHIHF